MKFRNIGLVGVVLFTMLCVGFMVQWMVGLTGAKRSAEIGPVVLAIQQMGELHTVSLGMKDVVRQESQVDPKEGVWSLPLLKEVAQTATRNQVLVTATGKVEAGIDLTRLSAKDITSLRRPDGSTLLRVHLPPITIYPPNVQVRVEDIRKGLVWTDNNIVPKAQEMASQQFLAAAKQSGIRQQAEQSAIQHLKAMEHLLGQEIEPYF